MTAPLQVLALSFSRDAGAEYLLADSQLSRSERGDVERVYAGRGGDIGRRSRESQVGDVRGCHGDT